MLYCYFESSLESEFSSFSSSSLPVGALANFPAEESTNDLPGAF
jgi:hypothetical protein